MAGRRFSTSEFFNARCAETKPLYAFTASDVLDAKEWRTRAIAKVRDLLGEMPEAVPLAAEVVESVEMESYARHKIIFDADAHASVPGYLLVPKGLKGPGRALMCLHGHGPGCCAVANVIEPRPDHTEEQVRDSIRDLNHDYARQFVERGYVTFTFDHRCFGERREYDFSLRGRDLCNVHFIRGSLLGINLLALDIHDTFRAIDFLCERPEVDPERVGCVGLSFGGTMTLWASALDKRIKAACISGYLCELERFAVNKAGVCGSQFVPALRRYFDLCDVAALIAPRPLLIESGAQDDGFPVDSARKAYERLRRAYEAWGEPGHVAHDVFHGGHQFHGEVAYEWFDRWL